MGKYIPISLIIFLCWTPQVLAIKGAPYAEESITVSSTAIGVTVGLCQMANQDTPALLQVKDASIYYTLHSATATPDSNDYDGLDGQIIEVKYPSLIRFIRVTTDAVVKLTCFTGK